MDRRSFLKLAGVSTLAAATAGALTGCGGLSMDELTDMSMAHVDIDGVRILMEGEVFGVSQSGGKWRMTYMPGLSFRNKSGQKVTIPAAGITCVITEKDGTAYTMTNTRTKDFELAPGEYYEVSSNSELELEVMTDDFVDSNELEKHVVYVQYHDCMAVFTCVGMDIKPSKQKMKTAE